MSPTTHVSASTPVDRSVDGLRSRSGKPPLPGPAEATSTRIVIRAVAEWFRVHGGSLVVLLALLLLVGAPVVSVLAKAFEGDAAATLRDVRDTPQIWNTLTNTVVLAVGSLAVALVSGVMLAVCAAHLQRRWAGFAMLVGVAPVLLPGIAGVTGWIFVFSPRVGYGNRAIRSLLSMVGLDPGDTGPVRLETMPGIVIVTSLYLTTYVFLFASSAVRGLDTRLEWAARVSGSSWIGAQLRITLPAIKTALVYASGIALLIGLGQFTVPLLLGRLKGIDVITTEIYSNMEYRLGGANYATASMLAFPVVSLAILLSAFQRFLLKGSERSRTVNTGVGPPRPERRVAVLPIAAYFVIAVVPVLTVLTVVALAPYWGAPASPSAMTLDNFRRIFDDAAIRDAMWNSIRYSLIATAIALVIGTATALYTRRTTGPARVAIELLAGLPITIPAILFGMGFLFTFGTRFYGTARIVVAAYVVLLIPHAVRMTLSGLSQVAPNLEHASRVAGAGPLRTTFSITIPLIRHHLVAAAMLMFILMSHEFAASVLLVGPRNQTIAPMLYGLYDLGLFPPVAALALVMVAISLAGVLLIALIGGRRTLGVVASRAGGW